ncbi:MAG: arsenate reductase family protein [Geminicoccaceae bacterium]
MDDTRARDLMLAHPALIKRPLFDLKDAIVIGFKPADQQKIRAALS